MATGRSYRDNFCSPRRVRREHAVEPDQGVARRRDERRQAGKELQWRHHAVSFIAPWFANGVRDATVAQHAQALEAERRPGAIAKKPFVAFAVARRDDHPRMHVEASHVATAPLGPGRRREGLVTVVDRAASAWQDGQLAQAERALQAGIER